MKKILFVCGHNSGRSQMAEVYFNTHNTNPDIEAISAGTGLKGDGKINPKVVDLLLSHGIDIHKQTRIYEPKLLTDEMLANADMVCTMGCMDNCIVGGRQSDFDFGLDDPAKDDTDVEAVYADLKTKMQALFVKYNS